jgi:hypothetical protein
LLPKTIRSSFKGIKTADPHVKNSGLLTTSKSLTVSGWGVISGKIATSPQPQSWKLLYVQPHHQVQSSAPSRRNHRWQLILLTITFRVAAIEMLGTNTTGKASFDITVSLSPLVGLVFPRHKTNFTMSHTPCIPLDAIFKHFPRTSYGFFA